MARLLVIVANTAQPTVNRRDGGALDKIDHVTKNRLWGGRQGAALVVSTPRANVFPVRGVGIEGVSGVTMGDIGTRAPGDLRPESVNRECQSWVPRKRLGNEYITRAYQELDIESLRCNKHAANESIEQMGARDIRVSLQRARLSHQTTVVLSVNNERRKER